MKFSSCSKILPVFLCCFGFLEIGLGQFPNIKINSSFTSFEPEEVTIAVNPTNPLNLVAGANINLFYNSTDGGVTWTENRLASTFGVWGDPCVIFDALGNVYYGHLSTPPSPGYWIDRIVVQKSTDGGQSWDAGTDIGFNPPRRQQDKDWFAADLTSALYRDNLYVAWTQFDSYGSADPTDSSRILLSRSTDHGQSWMTPVRVSDEAGNCVDSDSTVEGSVPAIGPNGEVYVSWAGPLGIMFDKSVDGGQTFGTDVLVASQPGGWDFGIPGISRANGLPVTACDVSSSPYRGSVYVQWSDQRNGVDNTDIFISKSSDGGQSWGAVKKVNDDITAAQQFFSWMTVDQSNGNVYVIFYDRRNTTGNATDVYVAKSNDGGESFINFKVSDSSFVPRSDVFFGDYTNIAARDGKVYPIWMRMDGTTLSVWTAIVDEEMTFRLSLNKGWNMVSTPVSPLDGLRRLLFPRSSSYAFGYHNGYFIQDSLHMGSGYWVKYPSNDSVSITGYRIMDDSIPVFSRWNMIGSISNPVPIGRVGSNPPGMAISPFYTYEGNGYIQADTLYSGHAYWVKANQNGKLILSSSGTLLFDQNIHITADGELPPAPPSRLFSSQPKEFALEQNYPDPFNPVTIINYQLPVDSWVTLKVFDLLGREVTTLANSPQSSGFKSVMFDASQVAGGVYFYRLSAGNFVEVKKMLVVK